jgi:dihydroorotate dehydrogenase (fumarate)
MTISLSTDYLGLQLAHPIMPGSSPLADDLDGVRRLEDAGAAAIVMRSLFQEQLADGELVFNDFLDGIAAGNAGDAYLEHVRRIRAAVDVPVIASLNGALLGDWIDQAAHIQEAGASALELNLYALAADPGADAELIEARQLELVRAVCSRLTIPVAVKLSPSYTALPSFIGRLARAGAGGAILFNRMVEPDIDPDRPAPELVLRLSQSGELLSRLRWLAILSPRAPLQLACSGGVHDATGALKAIMAGATAVQMVSALLRHGTPRLTETIDGLRRWLEAHGYASIAQARGCMNDAHITDPATSARGGYRNLLQSWRRATR